MLVAFPFKTTFHIVPRVAAWYPTTYIIHACSMHIYFEVYVPYGVVYTCALGGWWLMGIPCDRKIQISSVQDPGSRIQGVSKFWNHRQPLRMNFSLHNKRSPHYFLFCSRSSVFGASAPAPRAQRYNGLARKPE